MPPVKRGLSPLIVPGYERELQYRPTIDGWTPERVKVAGADADSGNLEHLCDLCETIMVDDRVDGVMSTRTHGLLGLPLTFVSGNELARGLLQTKDKAPGEWYKMHPESELVRLMTWGIISGVGLAQRVPLPRRRGQIQRYRLETWSPRWLNYNFNATGGVSSWQLTTRRGQKPVIPGAGQWVLFTPYGSRRPWSGGKWRSLAFPWLLKRFALEDRANHAETLGSPITLGKAPKGATERQRNRFLTQLVNLGKKGKIVLPEGWDLVLREAAGRTWEIYSDAVSWADAAITIILAGQVVTTEGSPGFNSGNVQERIVGDFIRFDAERLSSCMQEQSLEPWTLENWEDPDAPWPYWNTERPPDRLAIAQTLETMGRSIEQANKNLAPQGYRVDSVTIYKDSGVPVELLPKGEAQPLELGLAPTDLAKAFTLNEVRASKGASALTTPDGKPDPRGAKLMAEAGTQIASTDTPEVKEPNDPSQALPDLPKGA